MTDPVCGLYLQCSPLYPLHAEFPYDMQSVPTELSAVPAACGVSKDPGINTAPVPCQIKAVCRGCNLLLNINQDFPASPESMLSMGFSCESASEEEERLRSAPVSSSHPDRKGVHRIPLRGCHPAVLRQEYPLCLPVKCGRALLS